MSGVPVATARPLMRDVVGVLRPTDSINVVVFADGSRTFEPASIPASRANLSRALQFIGPKEGGGGTELLAAVKTALAIPAQPHASRTVVLLTDGYIDAEKDVFDYIRGHLDHATVFAFGTGSTVNRYL